ncbi:MAG: efflux RND transporter permease subunit [Gammaproteobacteria bacterium]|nr:efflux RND transporter permease subunit [Gammaproteobacteria bacterium]
MKNLIKIALQKPYTFVVLAILIIIMGLKSIYTSSTDVFPDIKIPVVAVVWSYSGLLPSDVSGRITFLHERAITRTVEGVQKIESNSYYGISIIKVFLQPGVDVAKAEAEITAISQNVIKILPPDISPPMVMKLSASSVPVAMLEVASDNLSHAELFNIATTKIRPQLVTIRGAILPLPYGGTTRQVMISLDPQKLYAKNMTAYDVLTKLQEQNLILPAGSEKINTIQWMVKNNAAPLKVSDFNKLPIKTVNDATVFLRDVGYTSLSGAPQQNSVLVDGKQAIMLVVMKSSDVSTLSVVDGVKKAIPEIEKTLGGEVKIKILNDAAKFVKDSIKEVVQEMLTATFLTGLVVLLFIGSWRSTIIISCSIPLSILTAIICLQLFNETINVMTLGGLALAVGILVDNATVMIENIHSHLAMNKPKGKAIIDAANQIIVPTFISTLCISLAWMPLFGITGISGFLFKPMALAIMFAMAASFMLSITLVPTMADYLLQDHEEESEETTSSNKIVAKCMQFQTKFEQKFEIFKEKYQLILEKLIEHRRQFILYFVGFCALSSTLFLINGQDFFPEIKSGILQMHLRAPLGTRVGTSGEIASYVSRDIKKLLPGQVEKVISNCGLPVGPHNLAFIPTPTIGSQDCDLTIALRNKESPVWTYRDILRKGLKKLYPGTIFTFQPADLTAKIINFGSPAPIDVHVVGYDLEDNYKYAKMLAEKFRTIPGATDVTVQQTLTTPTLLTEADRTFGLNVALTEKDVALNMILATAGSQQFFQQYWLNHTTGIAYRLNLYTPQYIMHDVNKLTSVPVKKTENDSNLESIQLAGNITNLKLVGTPGVISHHNVMPLFNVYVSAEGRALGSVLNDVTKAIAASMDKKPKKATVEIHGQSETMKSAYIELMIGFVFAIVLIYLLIVVNFQSWLDPFIIITGLIGAIAGAALFLFLTRTNLSVPALTGLIMSMGTATANSILVVAYARERMESHGNSIKAAIEAGHARIRPVLMTAAAMIIGMAPMSLSNTTNAPLGKAVIGGLILATFTTLFFVPCVYTVVYRKYNTT